LLLTSCVKHRTELQTGTAADAPVGEDDQFRVGRLALRIVTKPAAERTALEKFELGVSEVSDFTDREGQSVLRFMRPLVTEKECLKCHEFQGYKIGDIRGE